MGVKPGRNAATACGRTCKKRSTSASVVKRPSVTRSEPRARTASNPIASRTYEGSPAWCELHALPVETAICSSSSANCSRIASPSCPANPRQTWPGSR